MQAFYVVECVHTVKHSGEVDDGASNIIFISRVSHLQSYSFSSHI